MVRNRMRWCWVASVVTAALAVVGVADPASAQALSAGAPRPQDRQDEIRQSLLTPHVELYVRGENVGEIIGYVESGLGVALGAFGLAWWNEDRGLAVSWVVGGGVSTAAFATSLALSRDARVAILQGATYSTAGFAALGLAVAEDLPMPRLTAGAMAGAAFGTGILQGINLASRPTPLSRLRRHRDRLESGKALTAEELAEIERDFVANDDVLGQGVLALPHCAATPIAFAPAFVESYSKRERNWSVAGGSVLGLTCVLALMKFDLVGSYERSIEASGMTLVASPNGIEAQYRF